MNSGVKYPANHVKMLAISARTTGTLYTGEEFGGGVFRSASGAAADALSTRGSRLARSIPLPSPRAVACSTRGRQGAALSTSGFLAEHTHAGDVSAFGRSLATRHTDHVGFVNRVAQGLARARRYASHAVKRLVEARRYLLQYGST
jgi:hypothetical protein